MLLSNPGKYFLFICFLAISSPAGCSRQTNQNQTAVLDQRVTAEFPFSTKDPDIYQATLIVESGAFRDKWFVARKNEKWRIDFFENGELSRSKVSSDAVYLIDHKKKSYVTNAGNADSLDDLTDKFFKGTEYRSFKEIGHDGDFVKYTVTDSAGKTNAIIFVDAHNGLIMKQEFIASDRPGSIPFVYRVEDLKFEVDDTVFAIPAGFRRAMTGN